MTILFGQTIFGLIFAALFTLAMVAAGRRFLLSRYDLSHGIEGFASSVKSGARYLNAGLVVMFILLIYREIKRTIKLDQKSKGLGGYQFQPMGKIYGYGGSSPVIRRRGVPFTYKNVSNAVRIDGDEFTDQLRYLMVNEPLRLVTVGVVFVAALIYSAQRLKEPGEEWAGIPTGGPISGPNAL